MLDVQNLDFDYSEKRLLQGVRFTVNAGCLLHLRGGNGMGKTTLLKLLAGLMHPNRGDISYCGHSISKDIPAYQQNICYVGHKSGVSQLLTVRENCHFELHRDNPSLSFDELIRTFVLQGLEDIPCSLLSAGQQQRVGLLRLAMSTASLWLLDEPLVALDKEAVAILMMSINKHMMSGGLVVLTSHQNLPEGQENYKEYRL